ncbi:MAG: 3-isopropylmalate dehydratase large subunit [Candidatus Aenigmarchaeota archaeon]|nr:3-isopropylmalate dehydratase large subunit [Candidatus Aenigmarchaeota archaeon]
MDSFSKRILEDDSLTFAEKILNVKSVNRTALKAGDIAVVKVDMALAQDSTGPLAIKVFNEMGLKKVFDPKRIFLYLDHTYPPADEKVANLHKMVRDFCRQTGCTVIEGSISHQTIMEEQIVPGTLLMGADSHTNQAGALGAFATGIGSTEMAAIWASGKIWLRVPETLRVNVAGKFRKGVFGRDVIMRLIGQLGEDGANYKGLEWAGEAKSFSIDTRACICNNSVECGAKNSVFEYDKITESYLKRVGRKPEMIIKSGKDAEYAKEMDIDLNSLEPQVTLPEHVDRVKPLSEAEGVEVNEAFLGSTTNCRMEDLAIAAHMLKGRKVKPGTRLVITPSSRRVYLEAIMKGYVAIFMQAGATFTNSTCGACVGTHMGVLGENEVCISCSPRNYTGRMGALTAKVYLASPAAVVASAIEGRIADPGKYL